MKSYEQETIHRGIQDLSSPTDHLTGVCGPGSWKAAWGVSPHSLYTWIKQYGIPAENRVQQQDQSAEVKRL
jgi:hypothetical protein